MVFNLEEKIIADRCSGRDRYFAFLGTCCTASASRKDTARASLSTRGPIRTAQRSRQDQPSGSAALSDQAGSQNELRCTTLCAPYDQHIGCWLWDGALG